jgi:hypothetical protein
MTASCTPTSRTAAAAGHASQAPGPAGASASWSTCGESVGPLAIATPAPVPRRRVGSQHG